MNSTVTPQGTTTNSTKACVKIGDHVVSDILMTVYILVFIFGLIINAITLGPIWQQMRRGNILGIYLLCLSFSDILFIVTMPLWINYYYKNHRWELGVLSCSVAGFFYYSNMYISTYLLCCISIDRCLVVTLPLKSKIYRTPRCAWIACGCVYTLVVVLHIFVLYKDKLADAHDHNHDRCYETYPMEKPIALFNLIRVGIGFLLPLLMLAVSYWKVLATVGQSPGLSAQAKRKVRMLSFAVIGIFSICFAPYHFLLLVRSLVFYNSNNVKEPEGSYCQFEQQAHFFLSFTLALSSLNCLVDPVLYVLVSNGVREDVKMFWKRHTSAQTDDTALSANSRRKADANLI
ncbi:G protein-coupled receptor 184 [Notolabrus celidotus]|uniref:G protein-coupled receptor 184 n=1 Tax=Notolabrus celidotus TaxID=1203425 RepID=UPI00148FD5FB|nr:G protein-coupled receptor 184 [Notolabrus celidotus]